MMSEDLCHCIFYEFDGESCAHTMKDFFLGRRYNVQFSLHKLQSANIRNVSNQGVFILLLTLDSYNLIKSQKHQDLNAIFPSPEFSVVLLFSVENTKTEITTLLSSRIRDFSKWTILEYSSMSSLGIQIMELVEQLEEKCRRVSPQQVQIWPREGVKSREQVLLIFTKPVDNDSTVRLIQEWDSKIETAERLNPFTFCFTVGEVEPGEKIFEVLVNDASFGRVVMQVLHVEPRTMEISKLLYSITNPVEFICQCLKIGPSTREELDRGLQDLLSNKNSSVNKIFETVNSERYGDFHSNYELPTLLHFCAKHGFELFGKTLLRLPGCKEAMKMKNKDGLLPYQIARNEGFDRLASVLQNSDNVPCDSSEFDSRISNQYQNSPKLSPINEQVPARQVIDGSKRNARISADSGISDEFPTNLHDPFQITPAPHTSSRRMTNMTSVAPTRRHQAFPGKSAVPVAYGKMKKKEDHYHTIDD
ncbi:hypothetical protein CHS0354_024950 [Potamilus streckersoni]|uniref:DBB domain-containing protein n=1 Tax=Potamilus streckersoni TaxID=2493646 RepID=A0AAE0SQH2_9BIVA|nr:hypothetical protein CHS0354_024950 [Potamilus streckersoni]